MRATADASRGASREDGGAHGRLDRELQQLGRARLPVVDELGVPPLDADGARLLSQVVSQAYESHPVVFTTHLEFSIASNLLVQARERVRPPRHEKGHRSGI